MEVKIDGTGAGDNDITDNTVNNIVNYTINIHIRGTNKLGRVFNALLGRTNTENKILEGLSKEDIRGFDFQRLENR